MVFCAQMRAAFSSAARRDSVLADILQFANKPRFQASATRIEAVDLSDTIPGGNNGLIVEDLRFLTRQDAQFLLDGVRSSATGVRTPLAGSWVAIHDCSHDETTPVGCVIAAADRTTW